MTNVSHKNCSENQNTRFMFSNIFSKIVTFMRKCGNILYSHRKQYNTAHAHGMLDN